MVNFENVQQVRVSAFALALCAFMATSCSTQQSDSVFQSDAGVGLKKELMDASYSFTRGDAKKIVPKVMDILAEWAQDSGVDLAGFDITGEALASDSSRVAYELLEIEEKLIGAVGNMSGEILDQDDRDIKKEMKKRLAEAGLTADDIKKLAEKMKELPRLYTHAAAHLDATTTAEAVKDSTDKPSVEPDIDLKNINPDKAIGDVLEDIVNAYITEGASQVRSQLKDQILEASDQANDGLNDLYAKDRVAADSSLQLSDIKTFNFDDATLAEIAELRVEAKHSIVGMSAEEFDELKQSEIEAAKKELATIAKTYMEAFNAANGNSEKIAAADKAFIEAYGDILDGVYQHQKGNDIEASGKVDKNDDSRSLGQRLRDWWNGDDGTTTGQGGGNVRVTTETNVEFNQNGQPAQTQSSTIQAGNFADSFLSKSRSEMSAAWGSLSQGQKDQVFEAIYNDIHSGNKKKLAAKVLGTQIGNEYLNDYTKRKGAETSSVELQDSPTEIGYDTEALASAKVEKPEGKGLANKIQRVLSKDRGLAGMV